MAKRDYYKILGVDAGADAAAIKLAYQRLAMKHHPDRNRGDEQAAKEKFQEIQEAYERLMEMDEKKRAAYARSTRSTRAARGESAAKQRAAKTDDYGTPMPSAFRSLNEEIQRAADAGRLNDALIDAVSGKNFRNYRTICDEFHECISGQKRADAAINAFVAAGADVDFADKEGDEYGNHKGWTALMWTVYKYDEWKMKCVFNALFTAGADVNLRNQDGNTALIMAAVAGNTEAVGVLIEADADVNLPDKRGNTALMLAAKAGKGEAFNALLAGNADVDLSDKDGNTALMLLAEIPLATDAYSPYTVAQLKMFNALIAAGADVNLQQKSGWTALMGAAKLQKAEFVDALIAAGADANLQNKNGVTSLMLADNYMGADDWRRTDKITRALIAAGADVNLRDKNGCTALMLEALKRNSVNANSNKWISSEDKWAIVKTPISEKITALFEAGADVNLADKVGMTPLMWAASQGDAEMVHCLMAAGANANMKNNKGETALMQAVKRGQGEDFAPFVKTIRQADVSDALLLMRAAQDGRGEIVRALIAAGADVELQDNNGNTALDFALEGQNYEIGFILQDKHYAVKKKRGGGKRK